MAATTEFVAVQARLIGTELPDEPIPKLAFNRSQFFSEPIMRPSEVAGIDNCAYSTGHDKPGICARHTDLTEGLLSRCPHTSASSGDNASAMSY